MKKKKKRNTLPKYKGNLAAALAMRKVLERRIKSLREDAQKTFMGIMDSNQKNKIELIEKATEQLLSKWNASFDKLARELSRQMLTRVTHQIDTYFIKINKDYTVKRSKHLIKQVKEAILHENITLIKSIPEETLNKYSNTFANSIGSFDKEAISNKLKTFTLIGLNKIKLIARDQVAKAQNRYHMARAQALGFEYYTWSTSHDERVSVGVGGHKYLDERIYRFDKPTAIVDSYKNPGHPGDRVNCRCTSLTLITYDTTHLKLIEDKEHGDYYIETDEDDGD